VIRRPVKPKLQRSEERSWRLHRQISKQLESSTFEQWRPTILRSLKRLRRGTTGQPHLRNLDRWQHLVEQENLSGVRRVLTGLDRDSIEMREVSPMSGLPSQEERSRILGLVGSGTG
jgi:hypothetical protein